MVSSTKLSAEQNIGWSKYYKEKNGNDRVVQVRLAVLLIFVFFIYSINDAGLPTNGLGDI